MVQPEFDFMADLTSSREGRPAKTSPPPESEAEEKEGAGHVPASVGSGSVSWPSFVRALSSGRMSQGVFPRTGEPTSLSSWPRLATSGMAARGEFWTANTPEWTSGPWPSRSDGAVCGLSAVLTATSRVPPKYFLSRRACLGVLSRSERRGRPLPPALDAALREQAERCGCALGAPVEAREPL